MALVVLKKSEGSSSKKDVRKQKSIGSEISRKVFLMDKILNSTSAFLDLVILVQDVKIKLYADWIE